VDVSNCSRRIGHFSGGFARDRSSNAPLAFLILALSYPIYRVMKWAAAAADKMLKI